jgi:branched-chain amino acid transport system ATP-binding protein
MAEAALELRRLDKRFGALEVTRGVSLRLERGELHALIGPNGAGKSTLVAQIAGQLAPDAGSILLAGHDVTQWPAHRRARLGLGRSFQVSRVFRSLPASHNLGVARSAGRQRPSPWRRFDTPAMRAEAARHGGGEAAFGERPAGELAYGAVRELELAMSLAGEPSVLLLDEPLAGLSPAESEAAVQRLHALKGRVSILLIEHDIGAVFRLADRLSVLVAGAVIATGAPAAIRADPAVRAAYLGDE